MKLNVYIKQLIFLQETYGDLDLVYSKDDEDNVVKYVNYLPTLVKYNNENEEIITDENFDEYSEEDYIEVICIN